MSSIPLFNDNPPNINNGSEIIAGVVNGEKLEDIPSYAFPHRTDQFIYSSYIIETDRLIDNLREARFLKVGAETLSIAYIKNVTSKQLHPTYDIITAKED